MSWYSIANLPNKLKKKNHNLNRANEFTTLRTPTLETPQVQAPWDSEMENVTTRLQRDYGFVPPKIKRPEKYEIADLKARIEIKRNDVKNTLYSMIRNKQIAINKMCEIINQKSKYKEGPFNLICPEVNIDEPYQRNEKLGELQNLQDELQWLENKVQTVLEHMHKLTKIVINLQIKMQKLGLEPIYP